MRHVFLFLGLLSGCAHAPEPVSPDAALCVVTRWDIDTGVATDVFTFNAWGLASYAWRYSEFSFGSRTNAWEGGKLISASVDFWLGANDESVYGPWQDRMVVALEPTHTHHDLTFGYDDHGRLETWTTREVSAVGTTTHTSERTLRRVFNAEGRKVEEHETFNGAQTAKVTYTYDQAGRPRTLHTERGNINYVATMDYDAQGRIVGRHLDDGFVPPRWTYDEAGRLVSLGYGHSFVWNRRGEMMERNLGKVVRFEYEAGRLRLARYPDGAMYRQTYSQGCPVGFKHPLITPNTLYHEYYEGPPDHYTWSSY